MKKLIKTLVATLAIALVLPVAVSAATDKTWSEIVKEAVHGIADVYRSLGYDEKSATIRVNQLVWAQADGKDISGSYLYDSTNGQKYYLGTPAGGVVDGDYNDGTYQWFWNSSARKYYRFDKNGNKIWGEGSRVNNSSATSKAYTQHSANISGYNFTYQGVKLYAGRIYGLTGFNSTEVDTFAKLIKSYVDGQSLLKKSAFAWAASDLRGDKTLDATISKYYKYYDSGASITDDDREFAREMLFRVSAEKAGIAHVGRTLPKGYGWFYDDGNGNVYFRQSENGANYTFPNAEAANSPLRSPY